MTLKELATLANVSQSTVSKAFSGAKDVSPETKEHIFKVAKEHHCFEKFHKGNYFKKIVAVICPEIKSETYYRIVTHLETLFAELGISMVLSLSNFDPDTEKALFYYHAHYQKVDGIIIISSHSTYKDEELVPTVRLGNQFGTLAASIVIDHQSASNAAVKHLMDMGHRKIAFIGEQKTNAKLKRFEKSMQKWMLPIRQEYVLTSDKRFETAGYECMEKLLRLSSPPTAVICAYDYMALGALKCINDHGMSIPKDISLIGQDDIQISAYTNPTLTTIHIPYKEQCDLIIERLLKKMNNQSYTCSQENTLRSTLVIRDSVRNLKDAD